MTANELLDLAIAETRNIKENEVFLVKDLFKGYEWNRISRSNRLLLGTLFLNYINTSKTKISPLDKTSSGQQKYTIKSKY
ncbi:MAG: single-stranded DNA-binding protein [Clostridia bacterium]|nr:single-stranded DNA-binding protein [Clostridia bacterium]